MSLADAHAPAACTPAHPSAAPASPRPPARPVDDPCARREAGRAHLWSGEPTTALEVLAPVHRARPWDREVQHLMLDALFALGRTESDYPWTLEPTVVRMGPELLDRIAELLRREGGPVTVLDLVLAVTERGYPAFAAGALVEALEAERRFEVHRAGLAPECAVVRGST